jgi:hypothetical protein
MGITTSDYITISSAIVAIALAVFAFMLPRTLEVTRRRWKAMMAIDMPYQIRNNWKFRMEIFLDSFGTYILSAVSLALAIYFISLLSNVLTISLGISPLYKITASIPQSFISGITMLWWILWGTLILTVVLATIGQQRNESLPTIHKAFADIVIDGGLYVKVSQELMLNAIDLYEKEQYDEAIIHSTTALEYELRRMLNLDTSYPFASVLNRLGKIQLHCITPQHLDRIIIVRNQIAHKTTNKMNISDRQTANYVVNNTLSILLQLKRIGISTIYE